jgi:tetratricopeptide (TPR) repeat protein
MGRVLPAFFLLFAMSAAHASGYDDFSRGISASNRQADDQAISLFASALAAGDLNPSLQPVAYFYRGRVYLHQRDCDRALADFSAALRLKPDYPEALLGHADANVCANNLRSAIVDVNAAVKTMPTAPLYFYRARLRYLSQDFSGASNDLEQAIKLEPEHPYYAIWLGLAQLRARLFDPGDFAHQASQVSYSGWPYPVLMLLEGHRTPDEVMRAAIRDGSKGERCEADFYIAEWHLVSATPEAAKPLFQEATSICPRSYVELEAARIELSNLH